MRPRLSAAFCRGWGSYGSPGDSLDRIKADAIREFVKLLVVAEDKQW
jgi:hypothetical protein